MNIATQAVTEKDMANALRALTMDAVQAANSGHPGMPMGMADVAAVLFNRFVTVDPADHRWPDRDRFVLSAGHGSMLLYALNHLLGYPDMGVDQLRAFRQAQQIEATHEYILAQFTRRDGKSLARQLIEQFGMEQMNLSQIGRCRIFRHAAAMFHRRSAMRISANALPCD